MVTRLQLGFVRLMLVAIATSISFWLTPIPALAGGDAYVLRYLKATTPVELPADSQGTSQVFTSEDLVQGKTLFAKNCLNCHVGGATLPAPLVSLALDDLKGATPPRDNIAALVEFMRHPMTYDGSEESYSCREVTENWMSQPQVEKLSAFILRAAQVAPGWGSKDF